MRAVALEVGQTLSGAPHETDEMDRVGRRVAMCESGFDLTRSDQMKWIGVAVAAIVAAIVVTQWGELERYRRIRAM
jgi:hypothetical protein